MFTAQIVAGTYLSSLTTIHVDIHGKDCRQSSEKKQTKTKQQQQKLRDNADVDNDITMIIIFTETS